MFIFLKKQNKLHVLSLVMLLLIMAIFLPQILILIISLGLTFLIIKPSFDKKYFDSIFLKIILTIVIYGFINQSAIQAVWLFNKNFPLDLVNILTLILLSVVYLLKAYFRSQQTQINSISSKKIISKDDLIAIGITLLVIFSMLMPMKDFGGINYDFLTGGADDKAHLEMIDIRLVYNRGVIYKSDIPNEKMYYSSYPSAWHSFNANLIKIFKPSITVGRESMMAYAFVKIFWFFILLYLFCKSILSVMKLADKNIHWQNSIWFIGGTIILSNYFLANIFQSGFFSFFPQLISICIIFIYLLSLSEHKGVEKILLPLSVLAIVGCLSWVLTIPAIFVSLLFIIFSKKDSSLKKLILFMRADSIIYIFSLLALFSQMFIMLTNHDTAGSVSFIDGIIMVGGFKIMNIFFYIFTAIGVVLFVFFSRKNKQLIKNIIFLIAPIFLTAIIFAIIQLIKIGTLEYYFYKTLHISSMIFITLAINGIYLFVEKKFGKTSSILKLFIYSSMLVLMIVFMGVNFL